MDRMGYWAPVISGGLILLILVVARRHFTASQYLKRVYGAAALLCVGMIIGPLPWALDKGTASLRSTASMISIAASLSALLLMALAIGDRWRDATQREHEGNALMPSGKPGDHPNGWNGSRRG